MGAPRASHVSRSQGPAQLPDHGSDHMTSAVRILRLSEAQRPNFPWEWHGLVHADHFWVQWRFRVLLRALESLGFRFDRPCRALDVGCGSGMLRTQLHQASAWIVDGCDVDIDALELNGQLASDTLLYDVLDRRAELQSKYDLVFLMDVVEHIENARAFLEAVRF